MPATDIEQLLREAIGQILETDAGVQTAAGRASDVAFERNLFGPATQLPVLVYDLVSFSPSGPAQLLLTAAAVGSDAGAVCRDILRAGVAALTAPAFQARALPVVPLSEVRQSVELDDEGRTALSRAGITDLQQADATVSLLYLE